MSHEAIFHRGAQIEVGEVRCKPDDPDIATLGPIRGWCISFPRLPVQLRIKGQTRFFADGATALMLAPGAVFDRKALSADGSRCQWVTLSESLVDEIRNQCNRKREGPFGCDIAFGLNKSPALALMERRLFRRAVEASAGDADLSELVCGMLDLALTGQPPVPYGRGDRALADSARELLVAAPTRASRSDRLAARLGVSVFHLCRAFKRATGTTIQEFSRRLRLDLALERLAERDIDISTLALDLGFSSHSHFSADFRKTFGLSPSAYRERRRRRHRRAIA